MNLPDPDMCVPQFAVGGLVHGPPAYDSMRDRIVPMISDALRRTPKIGLDIIGWDMIVVPMQNAMLVGVAIAIRGIDLTGPGKEIMQFRPFEGWNPSQQQVDVLVAAIMEGLGEARVAQGRTVNGQ